MKNKDVEKSAEALMSAVAEVLITSRREYAHEVSMADYQQVTNACEGYILLETNNLQQQNEVQRRRKSNRKVLKRVAVVLLILFSALGATITVSEAARNMLYNAIFEQHEDHYVVIFGPEEKEAPVYREFILTYIPAGYECIFSEKDFVENHGGAILYEEYVCGEESFFVEIAPREVFVVHLDSENIVYESVIFDGIEGYSLSYGKSTALIWSDGRYEYELFGSLGVDEYIEISRGIKGFEDR